MELTEEVFGDIISKHQKKIVKIDNLLDKVLEYEKSLKDITSLDNAHIILIDEKNKHFNIITQNKKINISKDETEGILTDLYDNKKHRIVHNARRHIFYRDKIDNISSIKIRDMLLMPIMDNSKERNVIAIIWIASIDKENKVFNQKDMDYIIRFATIIKKSLLPHIRPLKPEETKELPKIMDTEEKTILLVDDDRMILRYLSIVLQKYYTHIISVQSGMEAIERFTHRKIDIIFIDEIMPGMNGHKAISEIRAIEKKKKSPKVPIVALTSDNDIETRKILIQSGVDKVVYKPIDIKEIVKIVKSIH